jgi:threonine dehydrogenase-like Zn-dependent dehydrogenase
LKLISTRRLDVKPLLTHRFPWRDAPQAYALLARGDLSAQAMLIDWRD